MFNKLCVAIAGMSLLLNWNIAQAAQVPIAVFPDPAQFGTVPLKSTGFPLTLFVSNVSANSVDVTGMTISGTNSGDFAFSGPACLGTLLANQTCQMNMTLTPSAMGNRVASLAIVVTGVQNPISVPLSGTGGNPIPNITSLSPPSAYVGSPSLKLTVNGSGFLLSSVVFWENSPLFTSYVSGTQITAQVPASDLTNTGSAFVYVTNPGPGGGTSPFLNFGIIALDPNLNSVSPISLVAGTSSSSIVLNGGNFMTGARVLLNGNPIPTTYISSGQLQAQLSTSVLAKAQIAQLAVSNPPPGGVSSTVTFNVTFPANVRILDLPANDLVWDPFARRIYASIPSSYGAKGNSVAVINPSNGGIGPYFFAGSEPTKLALSSDAKYLYAGLNGNGSVQRLVLPKFALDTDVSLGAGIFGGVNTASDLQVSPGDSHTFAVSIGGGCCGGGPLEFFKNATQLPNTVSSAQISDIVFAGASTLYGFCCGTVSQVGVDVNGGTLIKQFNGLVNGDDIEFDSGLIYGSDGQVLNPQTGDLVGTFDVTGSCCGSATQVLPDRTINRTFVLGNTPFFNSFGITSYNLSKFTPVGVTSLAQLSGNTTPTFIRWGSNGLAFILQSGCCGNPSSQVVVVQSPEMLLTAGGGSNPAPVASTLSPASVTHGGWNFTLAIQGKGFVPGSQVTWNGNQRTVGYMSPTKLTVYVPWSDIVSPGTSVVVVKNPSPGGGTSTALNFSIN